MSSKQSVRVALSLALVLGLAGLLALKGIARSQYSDRGIGFVFDATPRGIVVSGVSPGLPGDRAGLRPGDLLLAVEGVPLGDPDYSSYDRLAQGFERGRAVSFLVQREGSTLDLRISPGVPGRWGSFLLEAFTALCLLAVALLAISPAIDGDPRARLLAGYATTTAMAFVFPQDSLGLPWLQIAIPAGIYLVGSLQAALEIHLASLIAGRPAWLRRRPWIIPLCYAGVLGMGVLSFATFFGETILQSPLFPWTELQVKAVRSLVGAAGNLAVVALIAVPAFRHPERRERNQARLVLAATAFSLLVFVVLPVAAGQLGLVSPEASKLAVLAGLSYAVAFFVAIFRYDLFDIERVVRRSLIYTTLTTALVLIFYAAQGAGGALLSHFLDRNESVWAISLATLLLGLLFAPLRRFLHRLIDRRLFPERNALRQRLVALAGELPALGKLPRMGEHLVASLRDMFLARSATLLIADPETGLLRLLAETGAPRSGREETPLLLPLEDPAVDHLHRSRGPLRARHLATRSAAFAHRLRNVDPDSLMVPLLHQKKLIGALIVGPKTVGSYRAEEMDLLSLLAHHVAVVFENARLFESATYESLTGLLRREAILEQLERELERAQRYGRPLTVALADLDDFKKVNDRYGHLAGDTLLRQISRVISSELRSTDWIGRYGGEEFLIVLPETDLRRAGAVAEKIRSEVQRTVVPIEAGAAVAVTVSIGLASLEESGAGALCATARDLIASADHSLYLAKNHGRNRVHPRIAVLERNQA